MVSIVFSFVFFLIIYPNAKTIYSVPHLSETTNSFLCFTVDFMGTNNQNKTKKTLPDDKGGNAYGWPIKYNK